MKWHPALFKPGMVKQIIGDTKRQTRRIPTYMTACVDGHGIGKKAWESFDFDFDTAYVDPGPSPATNAGPYLQVYSQTHETTHRLYPKWMVGDRLWIRHNFWKYTPDSNPEDVAAWDDVTKCMRLRFGNALLDCDPDVTGDEWEWKPSIHMPRWASRVNVEITGRRIECIRDITPADVQAEGVPLYLESGAPSADCRINFIDLWDSINGKPRKGGRDVSWSRNPPVFVFDFRRLTGEEVASV